MKQKGKYIYIDPETQQRIVHSAHVYDIVYDMVGTKTIVEEDIPLIGAWEDWTGTGGVSSQQQQQWAGTVNTLQGSDEQITEGAKIGNLTDRGKNADTHRQRVRKKYVDLNV
jgi:hypothetical protein